MKHLFVLLVLFVSVFALPQYPTDSENCVMCKWLVAYTEAYSSSQVEGEAKESMKHLCSELSKAQQYQCSHFIDKHFHTVYDAVSRDRSEDEICGIHSLHLCTGNVPRWSSYSNPYSTISEDKKTEDVAVAKGLVGEVQSVELELVVDHSSVGDLTIELEHNGQKITLVHKPNCSPSGFYWITLSDTAAENIQNVCSNEIFRDLGSKRSHHLERKPIQGVFRPKDALDMFKGVDPNGEWKLSVFDNIKNEFQGTLNYWKLHFFGVTPKDKQEVSVEHTVAQGCGLEAGHAQQTEHFTIYPKDKWDNNVTASTEDFKFELSCGIPKEVTQENAKAATCTAGSNSYDCSDNIVLESRLSHAQMGGTRGNDAWGWVDPDGREWAIICQTSGTAFVDITDPNNPIFTAYIDTATGSATWRDAKVYKDHVFIISEASRHGMQVFDLHRLRDITNPPVTLQPDVHYTRDLTNSHNIFINEDTGVAYIVGATGAGCGGIYMVDINNPTRPEYITCHSPRYTHDIECIVYDGPDTRYTGKEICFCYDAGYGFTIKDVTDKQNIQTIGVIRYTGVSYCHQGWITPNRDTVLMNDELGATGRTYVFDVTDLENPKPYAGEQLYYYHAQARSSQHNNYIHDGHVYQSNYQSGVRILDISDPKPSSMFEAGYLDTAPGYNGNSSGFNGQWSLYPYFPSGNIVANDIQNGMFVFKYNAAAFHLKTSTDEIVFCDTTGENAFTFEVSAFDNDVETQKDDVQVSIRGLPSVFKVTVHGNKIHLSIDDAEPGHYDFKLVGVDQDGNEVKRSMVANVFGGKPNASFKTVAQPDGSIKVSYTVDKAGTFPLRITYKGQAISSDAPYVLNVQDGTYLDGVMRNFKHGKVAMYAVVSVGSVIAVVLFAWMCVAIAKGRKRRVAFA